MSDVRGAGGVPWLARFVTGAGVTGLVTGALAWLLVRSQLAEERIVVPGSASRMAGRSVKGPLTAYHQAATIRRIALDATGGKTYADFEEGEPGAETALDASLMRASLFTSILAFGIAASQMALGVVLVAVGTALKRLARRP